MGKMKNKNFENRTHNTQDSCFINIDKNCHVGITIEIVKNILRYITGWHLGTSGAGIMKLLNLQVSTERHFDWSPVPFRPIKLSVSA